MPAFKMHVLLLWFFILPAVFSPAQEQSARGYIAGTFLTGFGGYAHQKPARGFGTCVEMISGGTVRWANREANSDDTAASWPLIFDLKLISRFKFGLTFGDLLTISMNRGYQDANHVYFGLSYAHAIKRWELGASLIVFPVYITDDELIAGKIDASYWFVTNTGVTRSAVCGGTTGWADTRVVLFAVLAGISVKI